MSRRPRSRPLKEKIERFEICLSVFEGAGWYEGYRTTCGKVVDALECRDGPEDVIDLLDSYGVHGVNWIYLGNTYLYW